MQTQEQKQRKIASTFSFYLKCGAIFLLFLFSVLIVACSSGSSGGTNPNASATGFQQGPQPTITIRLGNTNISPTPALPAYWCGAWATQTTISSNAAVVGVNAKFTQNVNGNPEGIGGASATATVNWPDGTPFTQTVMTTPDGLAVFSIPVVNKPITLNRIILVTVTFTKGGTTCTVDQGRQAYFSLIVTTPTVTPNSNNNGNGGNNNNGNNGH